MAVLKQKEGIMRIKILDFGGKTPVRAHYNDAGADVYSLKTVEIFPGDTIKFALGFGLEIPDGYVGFIFPRSSLSSKGITCELPPIDSGYRGEIHAIVSNVGNSPRIIMEGDKIGQLVVLPVVLPEFVSDLGEKREAGAFGSSGR